MSLYSDLPITKKEQDAFGRTKFIDDLTNFIAKQGVEPVEKKQEHRGISDNLVIGIYGPWGSGKTSVVNCVQDELDKKQFETIYFNPWRYKDEDLLLLDLFKLIASKVSKKLDGDKKKQFSDFLLKYSKYLVLPKINFWGVQVDVNDTAQAAMQGLGEFLKEENTLDYYKVKINGFLNELEKPIVIFIDDIDRLDKHEIQLVFKTIKLTAAFSNIIYVLSFDDEMVAKSIGENYGEGREKDGKDFIEKIVQVPLRLPLFATDALSNYLIEYIEGLPVQNIQRNKIRLGQSPQKIISFYKAFSSFVTYYFKTTREAKRYINATSFALASLENINKHDVLFLEALRLKFPSLFKELSHLNNSLKADRSITNPSAIFNHDRFKAIATDEIAKVGMGRKDDLSPLKEAFGFIFGLDLIDQIDLEQLFRANVTNLNEKNTEDRVIVTAKFNEYLEYSFRQDS